ncbi:hypothetical protein F0P96_10185 [Hymenobacter busanensis]|uniref:Uncharacterized protein n=1 Tax=Hymenobacter busanensis TaxID=2607656 RepID=A0A7L4ZXJ5_9BACT|nr:hypothetical protein [Hymenobacter busanensis]KAA9333330.1 hypothetical protein F0P96_10185 [Hymenobacter busanensis]QHJ07991.1 hypothetical protein GUY19_12125 [Hymenobacter busanensis]
MRALLLSLLLGAAVLPALAAAPTDPPTPPVPSTTDGLIAQPWYRPHHLIGQVAGGQGMVTVGVGYTTLRGRLDVDVLTGYVPRKYSITPMGIFTGKATYSPWTLGLGASRWQVRPLSVGGLVNYTASRGMNASLDGKYPKGYYWWPARSRAGAFVGGRVAYELPTKANGQPRTASLYYELGTNDLYLVSLYSNIKALSVADILTLGIGVKVDL